jgi:hypothetical protein
MKLTSKSGLVLLFSLLTCGLTCWVPDAKQGFYFDGPGYVDFGQVKANDTSFNEAVVVNNSAAIYIVQKPKLTQNKYFWIIRNFSWQVDTIAAQGPSRVAAIEVSNRLNVGFAADSPGIYRDTVVIFSYPDTTHLLLSEPIVATVQ